MRNQCDFEFEFSNNNQIFEAGSSVQGLLTIIPKTNLRCNALKLGLRWRTHGKGNRAEGEFHDVTFDFYETELTQGQRYEVPFSFVAPSGPLTYHGHNLNIDWYLQAIVDAPLLPNFLDPLGETEILILPSLNSGIHLGPSYTPPRENSSLMGINWFSLVFGVIFTLVGAGVSLVFFTSIAFPSLFFGIIPLIFVGIGLAFIFSSLRNYLAASALSDIDMSFNKRMLTPDEELICTLRFAPRKAFEIDEVLMTLEAKEIVTRGSGSNRKTFTHTVFKQAESPLKSQAVNAGESIEVSTSFLIPPDATYTFVANDNALKWTLTAKIDKQGPLDWKQVFQIDVIPWQEQNSDG